MNFLSDICNMKVNNRHKTGLITGLLIFIFIGSIQAEKYGNASYYSSKLKGRHTSDGGKYHPDSMTCAHRSYPFGTILKVRNPKNDREVIVTVTDRGPHQRRLMIDLSYIAAETLDIIRAGVARVEITKLDAMPVIYPQLFLLPTPREVLKVVNSAIVRAELPNYHSIVNYAYSN